MNFDAAFSSPIARAEETLAIVNRCTRSRTWISSLLAEADIREWHGLKKTQIHQDTPDLLALWRSAPHLFFSADGRRPLHELYARIQDFISSLDPTFGRVLLVGHDHVNRALIVNALGLSITHHKQFPQELGTLSAILKDNLSGTYALRLSNAAPEGVRRSARNQRPRVFIVRHAVTEANVARVFQGHLDLSLNAEGVSQARSLALALRVGKSQLISSPLLRAVETARELTVRPIIQDSRLSEFDFGDWVGLSERQVSSRYTSQKDALLSMAVDQPIPNAERTGAFIARVKSSLDEIWELAKRSGRVVVVTHDLVARLMIALSLDLPLSRAWRFPIGNAEYSELEWDGDSALLRLHGEGSPHREVLEDDKYF